MENLSPHRKFKGPGLVKPALRPFYQHKWPKDLPAECQVCGTAFRTGFNLKIGPNKIGRFLKKAAYVSFLPCLVAPLFVVWLFPNLFDGISTDHGWWLYTGTMFFPPLAFLLLSLFMPIVRHLECKKCGWNRDYPGLKASFQMPDKKSSL